jgi:hypothetical protein
MDVKDLMSKYDKISRSISAGRSRKGIASAVQGGCENKLFLKNG